jgi:hypothetical protein
VDLELKSVSCQTQFAFFCRLIVIHYASSLLAPRRAVVADGGGGRDGMASADKKKCNAASVLIKRMARLRIRIGGG